MPDLDDLTTRRGVLYQAGSVTLHYREDCSSATHESGVYPDGRNKPSERPDTRQIFQYNQSFLPYNPQISGVDLSVSKEIPGYRNSGETADITLEAVRVQSSDWGGFKWVPENSAIEFEVELTDGLTLYEALFQNDDYVLTDSNYFLFLENNGVRWDFSSITFPEFSNIDPDDGYNEKWVFRFLLSEMPDFDNIEFLENRLIRFLEHAELKTKVRGLCNSQGESFFNISMFLVPADEEGFCGCRLPVNSNRGKIRVTCPGCINPGIVMGSVQLERTNYGAIDNNNNGIADEIEGVSIPGDNRRNNFLTLGDEFKTVQTINFFGGSPELGGFSYNQLLEDVIEDGVVVLEGIQLDNLYVTIDANAGFELISSNWNWKKIGEQYVFHFHSSQLGLEYFSPGDLPTIENQFKITQPLSGDKEIVDVIYQGILTDRDLDINSLSEFPVFIDSTCNERGEDFDCFQQLTVLKKNEHFYNHFCEPGNVASFLYIPIIHASSASIPTAHITNAANFLCEKQINFLAKYHHPGYNSFPYEARNYGSTIEFIVNVPPDYAIKDIEFENRSPYHIGSSTHHSIDHFIISRDDSRWESMVSIVTDPNGKGDLVIINVEMEALRSPSSGLPHTNALHWGDENLQLNVFVNLIPNICGSNSVDYMYLSPPLWNDQTKVHDNVYPYMDLNYKTPEVGGDYIFNIPDFLDKFSQFPRSEADIRLQPEGNTERAVKDSETCLSFILNHHPLAADPIFPGGELRSRQIVNTKNTFIYFNNLPEGFELNTITRINPDGSRETLSPVNQDEDANLFNAGEILGNSNAKYEVCASYDCNNQLANHPFQVIYGYNCDDFPSVETILLDDESSVCYKDSQQFTLTSYPFNLTLSAEILETPSFICEASTYQLEVISNEIGEVFDFEVEVEFPQGFIVEENGFKINGMQFIPLQDDDNPGKYYFQNLDVDNLKLGQSFIIEAIGNITCNLGDNRFIIAKVNAKNYCGTNVAQKIIETALLGVVSPESFDKINMTFFTAEIESSGEGIFIIDLQNTVSNSTSEGNVIEVVFPEGILFESAHHNGSDLLPNSSNGRILSFSLPIIEGNTTSRIEFIYSLDNTVLCENLSSFSANLIGRSDLDCYSTNCSFTETIASLDAISPICYSCNISANAGPDREICPGESRPIGLEGEEGVTYSWSPVTGLSNPNISNPLASPGSTQTYTLTATRGGCIVSDHVTVTVKPRPFVSLTTFDNQGSILCEGNNNSVTLVANASGAGGIASYTWLRNQVTIDDETGSSLAVSQTGSYRVLVVGENYCTNSRTANVIDHLDSECDGLVCPGESPEVWITNLGGTLGISPMQWRRLEDTDLSNEEGRLQSVPSEEGLYVGYAVTRSCTLATTPPCEVEFKPVPNRYTLAGPPFMLPGEIHPITIVNKDANEEGTVSVFWNTGEPSISDIEVSSPGDYTFTATLLSSGCSVSSSVDILMPGLYLTTEGAGGSGCGGPVYVNIRTNGFDLSENPENIRWFRRDPGSEQGTEITDETLFSNGRTRLYVTESAFYEAVYTGFNGVVISRMRFVDVSSDPVGPLDVLTDEEGRFEGVTTCSGLPSTISESAYECMEDTWLSEENRDYSELIGKRMVNIDPVRPEDWNRGLWTGTALEGNAFLLVDGDSRPGGTTVWSRTLNVSPADRFIFQGSIINIDRGSFHVRSELPEVYLLVTYIDPGKDQEITLRHDIRTIFEQGETGSAQDPWIFLQTNADINLAFPDISTSIDPTGFTQMRVSLRMAGGGAIGRDIGVDDVQLIQYNHCTNFAQIAEKSARIAPALSFVEIPRQFTCYGIPVTLRANDLLGSEGMIYEWQDLEGNIVEDIEDDNDPFTLTVNPKVSSDYVFVSRKEGSKTMTRQKVRVNVIQPYVRITTEELSICQEDALVETNKFHGISNVQYKWYVNDDEIETTQQGFFSPRNLRNNDEIKVALHSFCKTSTDQELVVFSNTITAIGPDLVAIAGDNQNLCRGASVMLGSEENRGVNVIWSPEEGLSDPTSLMPEANPVENTIYTLTISDENGCSVSDEIEIEVVDPVHITEIETEATLCLGSSVELSVQATGGEELSYSWSPAVGLSAPDIPNPEASPEESTTYTVIVRNEHDCEASEEVLINVVPVPVADAGNDFTFCLPNPGPTRLGGLAEEGLFYNWTSSHGGMNMNTLQIQVYPTETTTYTLRVSNGICFSTDDITLTVANRPRTSPRATGAFSPCPGVEVEYRVVQPLEGMQYSWSVPREFEILEGQGTPVIRVVSNYSGQNTLGGRVDVRHVTEDGCGVIGAPGMYIIRIGGSVPADAGPDQKLCIPNPEPTPVIQLGTPAVQGVTYRWTSVPTGFTSTQAQPVISNPTTRDSRIYRLEVRNGDHPFCRTYDEVKVDVVERPSAPEISGPSVVCVNEPEVVFSTNPESNVAYSWVPSSGVTILEGEDSERVVVNFTEDGEQSIGLHLAKDGCGMLSPVYHNIHVRSLQECISGIGEELGDLFISIYPNPFTRETVLHARGNVNEMLDITIYDVKGITQFANGNVQVGREYILGSDLRPGVYFVKVQNNESVKVFKLIKTD
ncbi:MAG: T9SS type A sorting domain-containing protein [Cytophagaceae bacterium]